MKLEEMAQVMIGVLTKREKDNNGENSYELFSLKNYEEKNIYEELKTNKNLSDKLAQNGDLLFRLLAPNKIIYVDENIEGKLIPSQFCIIRTDRKKISPIVLKWYLESDKNQSVMESLITGSIIKSMTVTELKKIEIPNIAIENQLEMEKLINLWERERIVFDNILKKKEKIYNWYLEQMVNKGVIANESKTGE